MNRVLELLRGQLAQEADDRHLLDRFLAERDEEAFAEVVRRYGPLVWGVCRRQLANRHDAEDAFQATFLVLVRRAARLDRETPLGPWLHRVAAMTARNVIRGNRRRAPITGPMEHEVSAHESDLAIALDLDAALLTLPERDRVAIVLCHLQGLSRREAAERLGCPEGTLSARLHRAMARLRSRFGERHGAALAVMGAAVLPAGLAAATVHAAVVFTTSTLVGVSPTVAGLTDGVLRMFWMKKLAVGAMLAMFVAGGLFAGFVTRLDGVARATEPLVIETEPPTVDADTVRKQVVAKLDQLARQKAELDQLTADLNAQLAKFDAAFLDKMAAADLGNDLAIVVTEGGRGLGWSKPPYTVREVVNGKVGEMQCYEMDILGMYLTRAFNDSKGPKKIRIYAEQNWSHDQIYKLFAVCAQAGYQKARFILPEAPWIASGVDWKTGKAEKVERGEKEKEIDLTKYGPKKPR